MRPNPSSRFLQKFRSSASWKNPRLQIGFAVLLLVTVGIGAWLGLNAWRENQVPTSPPETEEADAINDLQSPQVLLSFNEQASAIEVEAKSRCVQVDLVNSGWNSEAGTKVLQALNPTLWRVEALNLATYLEADAQNLETLVAYQNATNTELFFALDIGQNEVLLKQIRAIRDFQEAGGQTAYLELNTSLAQTYSNQLTRTFPQITETFPGIELVLQWFPEQSQTLETYPAAAYATELAYSSEVESYENLARDYPLSLTGIEATTEALSEFPNDRPLWVTKYRLVEEAGATSGTSFSPFENLKLGGTWAQALTTSFGYHQLLLNQAEAVCINTLSGSPQNSLYYLAQNTAASNYQVLNRAQDYEFSPVGQAFFMFSKAVGEADEENSREFLVNNQRRDVIVWVFSDEVGTRAWVVNTGQAPVALDVARYGFRITGYETKSAPLNQVILSRRDVLTQTNSEPIQETQILLARHSISTLSLESVETQNE